MTELYKFAHSLGNVTKYHQTVDDTAVIMFIVPNNTNGTHACAAITRQDDGDFMVTQTVITNEEIAEKMFRAIVGQLR